jgi:hypothetical protein
MSRLRKVGLFKWEPFGIVLGEGVAVVTIIPVGRFCRYSNDAPTVRSPSQNGPQAAAGTNAPPRPGRIRRTRIYGRLELS